MDGSARLPVSPAVARNDQPRELGRSWGARAQRIYPFATGLDHWRRLTPLSLYGPPEMQPACGQPHAVLAADMAAGRVDAPFEVILDPIEWHAHALSTDAFGLDDVTVEAAAHDPVSLDVERPTEGRAIALHAGVPQGGVSDGTGYATVRSNRDQHEQ